MERRRVLVADHAWPDLDVEREILAAVDAELLVAPPGSEAELAALAGDVQAILVNWRNVGATVLDAAPRCLLIARYGVGVDNIDVSRAGELGMLVTNVPVFCADEVAEHALALILALARQIVPYARMTAAGGWDLRLSSSAAPIRRLRGRTLGIVGYGQLGRALAPRAVGLGLRVLAHARSVPRGRDGEVELAASLEDLLERSDIVSLHVPLTDSTRGLIGAAALARMRPGALLVNTSRGAVVDSAALADALGSGRLAGAGLDVLPHEPPEASDPLLAMENVIITPHTAAFSVESLLTVRAAAARSVADVIAGRRPSSPFDPSVLAAGHLRAGPLTG